MLRNRQGCARWDYQVFTISAL